MKAKNLRIENCHLGLAVGVSCNGDIYVVPQPNAPPEYAALREFMEEIAVGWLSQVAPHRLKEPTMTEDQIKQMTERFLAWRLPENFHPDSGIIFKAEFNENTDFPMKHKPTGTNLLDYTQAEAMIEHLVEGI